MAMIRQPRDLATSIRQAVDRKAVLFSHFLFAITACVHTALDPTSLNYEIAGVIILCSIFLILALFRSFDLASLNNHPRRYLTAYIIIAFLGLAFFTDPVTPYDFLWFIIIYLMNLYYGARGVWITVAAYGLTSLAKLAFMTYMEYVDYSEQLYIVAGFFIFTSIASFFVNVQKVFDWDRLQLRKTSQIALVEQKRLLALINSMTESVLVLDNSGVVRLYNAATLALLDTNRDLNNQPLSNFAHFEKDARPLDVKAILPTNNLPSIRNDILLRYDESDVAALSMTITPIRTAFGSDVAEAGYILTMRDITREKSLEEERDEFISVISHELRTPVAITEANISNALFVVESNKDISTIQTSLAAAHEQALFLANMINDLSTLSRAERGKLNLTLEEIDVRELVDELYRDYQESIEAKGLQLVKQVENDAPRLLVSNRLYVKEILQNFITNAQKYTKAGTIILQLAKSETGNVRFSVTDTGIGISTSDQKKIFNKFYRSEDYRTRETSGTGLGLYITKKLMELIGAKVTVISELNKGSTFSVDIPNTNRHRPPEPSKPATPLQSPSEGVH